MVDGKYLIALDAGHGGSDPGAVSVIPNINEAMLTLILAKAVKERLLRSDKFAVWMSREDNTNPGNASWRGTQVGKMKADFALSIHFNAFNLESANGTECYVPNQEKAGKIEYYIKEEITKLFKERVPYCKGKNYANGAINDKSIDPKTMKFLKTYPQTDYYGFIREAWKYGVSADLIEICFVTNEKDLNTYLDNQDKVADIIASAIYKAFGVEYTSTVPNPPTGLPEDTVDELKEEIKSLYKTIDSLQTKLNQIKDILD